MKKQILRNLKLILNKFWQINKGQVSHIKSITTYLPQLQGANIMENGTNGKRRRN